LTSTLWVVGGCTRRNDRSAEELQRTGNQLAINRTDGLPTQPPSNSLAQHRIWLGVSKKLPEKAMLPNAFAVAVKTPQQQAIATFSRNLERFNRQAPNNSAKTRVKQEL
jgi:hypothetical protein